MMITILILKALIMKNKLRVIFYLTPWKPKLKYWLNWLISVRTWSKYSHVELQTPDDGIGVGGTIQDYWDAGTCWTSTLRGKDNGTVSRPASEVLDHPENWHYIEFEIEEDRYDTVIEIMKMAVENNKGYSTWDCLKFISPIHFPDNDRYICSEFVIWILFWAGLSTKTGIVSPQRVHDILTEQGLKTKELK